MFAPSVIGYICSNRITPIPTSGVKVEVVIEDDWTRMVTPTPISIARYPLMLKDLDQSEKADKQDDQTQNEDANSRSLVIGESSISLEECRARIRCLVTGNQTNIGASIVGRVGRIGTVDGVVILTAFT